MTTQTTNQTEDRTAGSYAAETGVATSETQKAEYAQPKACHCTADSPCKKDGICRCKLFSRFKEPSLEETLVGVESQ